MINLDDFTNANKPKHNSNWYQILSYIYKVFIMGDSESGKTNALLNLIYRQPDIEKIYLYAKDPYKAIYQLLIKKM